MTSNHNRTGGWPPHRVTGVDVWPYRRRGKRVEFLLLHRSGRDGPPFWQGGGGWIEAGELPHTAALRELAEETGLRTLELFGVDAVFDLYRWRRGTVEVTVPFAARVRDRVQPVLSEEHDAFRWCAPEEALALLPYEPQREALRRILADILDHPQHAELYRIPLPRKSR